MATVQVGIFTLTDPPPGQEAEIRRLVAAMDVPWDVIEPRLAGKVEVRWVALPPGKWGQYLNRVQRIELTTAVPGWESAVPYYFVHEVGHLIDYVMLDDPRRQRLIDLFHASPETRRWAGQIGPGGAPHGHDHDRHAHEETWRSTGTYDFRISEAFADLFVLHFSTGITHGPRYVHATGDRAAFRRIVLDVPTPTPIPEEPVASFTDVDPTNPHRSNIERAADLGLMSGTSATTFNPKGNVTREQLASTLVRLYDRLTGG